MIQSFHAASVRPVSTATPSPTRSRRSPHRRRSRNSGTNGGGILAANSAHPFENPTPVSNIVEIVAILLIPVALTRTFGTMVGDRSRA